MSRFIKSALLGVLVGLCAVPAAWAQLPNPSLTTTPFIGGQFLTSPVISGTVTGTYTLGGTPTITVAGRANLGINLFNPVTDHGAPTDGTSDATTAIAASLTDCANAGGGSVQLPAPYQFQIASASITVPRGCALEGLYHPGADQAGSKYSTTQPALLLNSAFTINVASDAAIRHVAIFNPTPLAISTTTIQGALSYSAAFAGTAVTVTGNSTSLEDVFIIGFGTCYTVTSHDRPNLLHVSGDCTNPMVLNNVQDVGVLDDINWHTFMPVGTVAEATQNITGAADNGSGAIRLTVASTSNFLTGNTGFVRSVGGFTGANSKWAITVVDGTHIDLQSSSSAPATTGVWNSGSKRIIVNSTSSLGIGQTVTGAGIPASDTISFIDYQASVIYLANPTTASGNGAALTFANPAYTSGGIIQLSADTRIGTAVQIINSDFVIVSNIIEYGWEIGYALTSSGSSNKLLNASCDMEAIVDTASVCVLAADKGVQWTGGSVASDVASLYDTSLGSSTISDVGFIAVMAGSVPISVNSDDLLIANSSIAAGAGVSLSNGSVLMNVGPSIAAVHLSNDRFGIMQLAGEPKYVTDFSAKSLAAIQVDWATSLFNWLYSPSNENLLLNPAFTVDQPNEGAVYNGVGNVAMMDGWHEQAGNLDTTGWNFARVSSTLPNAKNAGRLTIAASGTPTSSGFLAIEQRIEGSRLSSLGFGTQQAEPLSLSFEALCNVSGTFSVNLSNGATNNRAWVQEYTVTANVPALETFEINGDVQGSWTLSGNSYGLSLNFLFVSGSGSQTSALGQWATGSNITGSSNQTQLSTSGNTCDIANVKLEVGVHPTVFVSRNPANELLLAQRYFRKTIPQGTAVGQSKGVAGSLCVRNPIANGEPSTYFKFDPPMVSTPTVTTGNPSAANANWRDVTGAADIAVAVDPATAVGTTGVEIATGATVATIAHDLCIHAWADSRL